MDGVEFRVSSRSRIFVHPTSMVVSMCQASKSTVSAALGGWAFG